MRGAVVRNDGDLEDGMLPANWLAIYSSKRSQLANKLY